MWETRNPPRASSWGKMASRELTGEDISTPLRSLLILLAVEHVTRSPTLQRIPNPPWQGLLPRRLPRSRCRDKTARPMLRCSAARPGISCTPSPPRTRSDRRESSRRRCSSLWASLPSSTRAGCAPRTLRSTWSDSGPSRSRARV